MPLTTSLLPHHEATLHLPEQDVFYRIYRPEAATGKRRLLLIHGAGLAGIETWGHILQDLQHWGEILVPDIRGTGKTFFPDRQEHSFEVEQVVADMVALLDHLHWDHFDLGGYSFGGMVAMLLKQAHPNWVAKEYLVEPGLLIRLREEDAQLAHDYLALHAARGLRNLENFEAGLEVFLDAVSPNRRKAQSAKASAIIEIMSRRPVGMACVVEAAAHLAKRIDRAALLAAQEHVSFFVGDRSNPEIHELSCHQATLHSDWQTRLIAGADHGLPYQRGAVIAQHMNQDLLDFLQR